MLIIIDAQLPRQVIEKLSPHGTVFQLKSNQLVYDSISGHPDIFIFQMENLVIIAPNSPKELMAILKSHRIPYLKGKEKLGSKFPETAYYNALCTSKYLIHRKGHSTGCILKLNQTKKFINVNQAYTRCNLLNLPDGSFITSDQGIIKALQEEGLETHYFSSEDILLNGHDHGFLPGAMGIFQDKVFIIGTLSAYREGERLKTLLESKSLDIIELYQGPLIDGGGIFFLNP